MKSPRGWAQPALLTTIDAGWEQTTMEDMMAAIDPVEHVFLQHASSGDTYAAVLNAGMIFALAGPLHHSELKTRPDGSPSLDYNYETEDAEWANTRQWRTVGPR